MRHWYLIRSWHVIVHTEGKTYRLACGRWREHEADRVLATEGIPDGKTCELCLRNEAAR